MDSIEDKAETDYWAEVRLQLLREWTAEHWQVEVSRGCATCGEIHYQPGTMTRRWGRYVPAQSCQGDGGDIVQVTLLELAQMLNRLEGS